MTMKKMLSGIPPALCVSWGNSELLELRLLETGFLSRFQLNPSIRWVVFDVWQKKKNFSKEIKKYLG